MCERGGGLRRHSDRIESGRTSFFSNLNTAILFKRPLLFVSRPVRKRYENLYRLEDFNLDFFLLLQVSRVKPGSLRPQLGTVGTITVAQCFLRYQRSKRFRCFMVSVQRRSGLECIN